MTNPIEGTVHGLTWVARLVDDEEFAEARRLGAALGFVPLVDVPTKLMLQTPRGEVVEFCLPGADVPSHLFEHQDTVIGFAVTDLEAVVATLSEAGFAAVNAPVDAGPVRFQHVRSTRGQVYGLIQHLS
jgi:hypothetical protein